MSSIQVFLFGVQQFELPPHDTYAKFDGGLLKAIAHKYMTISHTFKHVSGVRIVSNFVVLFLGVSFKDTLSNELAFK